MSLYPIPVTYLIKLEFRRKLFSIMVIHPGFTNTHLNVKNKIQKLTCIQKCLNNII